MGRTSLNCNCIQCVQHGGGRTEFPTPYYVMGSGRTEVPIFGPRMTARSCNNLRTILVHWARRTETKPRDTSGVHYRPISEHHALDWTATMTQVNAQYHPVSERHALGWTDTMTQENAQYHPVSERLALGWTHDYTPWGPSPHLPKTHS